MSERDNEITGAIISIIAYYVWSLQPSISFLDSFSKGELAIFCLLLGAILLWSAVHAACFILDIIASIICWIHQIVFVEDEDTKKTINNLTRKIGEIYQIIKS